MLARLPLVEAHPCLTSVCDLPLREGGGCSPWVGMTDARADGGVLGTSPNWQSTWSICFNPSAGVQGKAGAWRATAWFCPTVLVASSGILVGDCRF